MKRLICSIGVGIVTVMLAGPVAADDTRPLVPSMTVVGTGEVSARPDTAEVQAGVVTQAPSAAKALEDNNSLMEKVLKSLTARGIAEKDVQTSNLQVTPMYDRDQGGRQRPNIVGYQVTNQVRVKVRQLANLGSILDELVSVGANRIQGIHFSVAEPDALLDAARHKAMGEARRKAEVYARAGGLKLGRVLLVQEDTPHLPQPRVFAGAEVAARGVPIAVGEQEFRAHITVTYALE
jgi:uncharacterized protein YggE